MPRSRASEMPQRQSPRGPLQLRTSSLESDASHSTTMSNRSTSDRIYKPCDRRSPRSTLPEPKKRGTRIADLESQLNQTQEELKKLKEQLASSEAAKKEAQQELENTKKQQQASEDKDLPETHHSPAKETAIEEAISVEEEPSPETDVFEVLPTTMPVEPKVEPMETRVEQEKSKTKPEEEEFTGTVTETEKPSEQPENPEITELKAKLAEKDKELESFGAENDGLKKLALEAEAALALIKAKEEDSALKLSQTAEELEESNARTARVEEQLKTVEGAKAELENEMKRLRVQTEQWRKAADAAAAVLAGGVEMNGRRVAERCGSMDKHLGAGGFDAAGYVGFGSPMMELDDEGLGGGKRKGAGIRMFGDLWKKKGQK